MVGAIDDGTQTSLWLRLLLINEACETLCTTHIVNQQGQTKRAYYCAGENGCKALQT